MSVTSVVFAAANLLLVAGYTFAALFLATGKIRIPTKRWWVQPRASGLAFFILSAASHSEIVFHAYLNAELFSNGISFRGEWHIVLIYVVKSVALWYFIVSLYFAMKDQIESPLEVNPPRPLDAGIKIDRGA